MSASSATLPNRDAPAGARPDYRPLSAIAAAAGGGVPQARIRRVLADLVAPLAQLHAQGRVHGAIAMNTVGLDASGKAHLLVPPLEPAPDAEGGVRIEGYAAFEQYTDDPERPCGPWTDIYALSAVAHAMLVGAAPPAALARCVKDTYAPLAGRELGAYDPEFLRAVDRGLAMTPAARAQDMDAFARDAGLGIAAAPAAAPEPLPAEPAASAELPPVAAPAASESGPRVPLLVMLGVLAAVALAVYLWLRPGAPAPQSADRGVPPVPAPAPAPEAPVPTPPALSELGARPADPAAPPANPPADTPAPPSSSAPPAPPADAPAATPPAAMVPVPTAPEGGAPAGTIPNTPDQAPPASVPPAPSGTTPPDAALPSPGDATGLPGTPAPAAPGTPPAGTSPAGPGETGNAAAGGQAAAPGTPAEPPQPEETPPPASVAVRVHVQPWGEVLVDGRSRGISPPLTELTLSPGRHRVTIRNPAAPDYETTINVSAGGSAAISHVFE